MIMNMHFSVKVFGFSPNQSRPNGSFDRERTAICKAPLKDTAEHAIDGVVLGITLKVGVKSAMTFDGDDGREIEFTGLERLSTATMRATVSKGVCMRYCMEDVVLSDYAWNMFLL